MENFEYYLLMLAALVVAVLLIKKITGCIFRIVVTLVLLGVLGYILHLLGYLPFVDGALNP